VSPLLAWCSAVAKNFTETALNYGLATCTLEKFAIGKAMWLAILPEEERQWVRWSNAAYTLKCPTANNG